MLFVTAATVTALSIVAPAQAQRVWRDGQGTTRAASAPIAPSQPIPPQAAAPVPPRAVPPARLNPPQGTPPSRYAPPRQGTRWGAKVGGRWYAGSQAPGGWDAYRRPVRGWTLPSYWMGGSFGISDFATWGLSRPPYGYFWVRYYDDAVLVDRGGRVWDSVSGVDWDGGAYAYADGGYGADYDAPGYDYDEDDRYDRDDRRGPKRPPYRGGYAPPPAYAPPPPPRGCAQACSDGYYAGQGYYAGGYYIIPPSTTVVVVGGGTTTTTTVTEEVVQSGARYVEKRVVRRAPTKLVRRTPSKQLYR
jgi:hypothetical protein